MFIKNVNSIVWKIFEANINIESSTLDVQLSSNFQENSQSIFIGYFQANSKSIKRDQFKVNQ